MSAPFFITGLPRSRTSWLANLLTTDKSFCHHDLLGSVPDMQAFEKAMRAPGRVRGDSDSGLLFVARKVVELFYGAPWVVVTRGLDQSIASLKRAAAGTPWERKLETLGTFSRGAIDLLEEGFDETVDVLHHAPNVLFVRFGMLDDRHTVETIYKHCLPGLPFDLERFTLLHRLRVEPMQSKTPLAISKTLAVEIAQETR